MAKTDNLTDFLTGVAGAIRTKKGTTAKIDPQDFESEIGSIDTAKPEQTKTLTVTENGTQTVKPDTGKVLSGVTVTTNVPATPTEEKTVDLAMASGNQVVTPTSGKHLTKVTITKPATLAAGNIKSGVNIGGVTGTLSPAKTEQAKTVDLAMASGNQVVSPDSGKVLSGVTITKPTTLVASNIKKGVTIGGVAGSYAPTTETKTVALAMGSGNQVISKSSSKDGMTQVTVTKPSTMLPANIKKGVNIGGVTGTYEGESSSSSGGEETWTLDNPSPSEITTGDGDYADQQFYTGLDKTKKWWKIVVANGIVTAVAATTTNIPEKQSSTDEIAVQASRDDVDTSQYNIGKNNSFSEAFEYDSSLITEHKKMVFSKPVTGTLLQVLTAIAVKQPTNYATQGYGSINKTKSVIITSNGTTTITPDAPYDAMKSVKVTVNVPAPKGVKVTLYSNKTMYPTNIYDAMEVDSSAPGVRKYVGTNSTFPNNISEVVMSCTSGYITIDSTNGNSAYLDIVPTITGVAPTLISGGKGLYTPLVYKLNGDCTIYGWNFACLIKGTLITLADGSKKPVEDITYDDELLVWNFYKGCFDKAKPRWIKIAQTANVYNKLTFDNGATLGLVGEGGTQGYHRIFNEQARLFTHTGVPETPIGTITFAEDCTKPTLVKQELVHEEVEFYNVITETHFNLFANGILTSCKNSNKYYIENMKYVTDKELMTDAEIEQDMLNREPIKLKKEIK